MTTVLAFALGVICGIAFILFAAFLASLQDGNTRDSTESLADIATKPPVGHQRNHGG